MDLGRYLELSGRTRRSVAKEVGISEMCLRNYINKKRKIPLWVALKIEKITYKKVQPKDWESSNDRDDSELQPHLVVPISDKQTRRLQSKRKKEGSCSVVD